MFYVLFDSESGKYINNPWGPKQYSAPADGKLYKYCKAAINTASLLNVDRNVPAGWTPTPGFNNPYRNRPQVVVHGVDLGWNVVSVHQAPPNYIRL